MSLNSRRSRGFLPGFFGASRRFYSGYGHGTANAESPIMEDVEKIFTLPHSVPKASLYRNGELLAPAWNIEVRSVATRELGKGASQTIGWNVAFETALDPRRNPAGELAVPCELELDLGTRRGFEIVGRVIQKEDRFGVAGIMRARDLKPPKLYPNPEPA